MNTSETDFLQKPAFREEKAAAAASIFVKLCGGSCDKYWLNKVMYYVERQSLVDTGQPMYFDALFSIRYGPIVSAVSDGIDNAAYAYNTPWNRLFTVQGNDVILNSEADTSLLSDYEIDLIQKTTNAFQGWTFNRLKDFFHNLPEHTNTESRIPISYEAILLAEGYAPEQVQGVMNELTYLSELEQTTQHIQV